MTAHRKIGTYCTAKMNILYLSSKKRWGGVSSWMLRTAHGLEKRGHRVWIIAHPDGRFARSVSSDIHLIKKKLGMDYNPFIILYLCWFIKTRKIDLVVTNIEKEVIAGGIAARLCGVPNIRRVGREDDFNNRFKVKWRHKLLVNHSIVPCDLVRNNAAKRAKWLNMDSFTTIYNGRNPRDVSADAIQEQRRRWGVPQHHLVIGVTTQLATVKRVDGIVRVFDRLAGDFDDISLVISGEGKLKPDLEALAGSLAASDHIHFAGFAADPVFAAACYHIAVSNSEFEGFPNTIVEYFAAGTATVTTDAGGVGEMARHNRNALIIPVNNEHALYQALKRLIGSPDLRMRLGKTAQQTVASGFSEDLMMTKLEQAYANTIPP